MTHQAWAPVMAQCESVRWPPEPVDTVFYWTEDRVLRGTLREVRHGLLWTDFLLEDGTIVDYNRMVMRPAPAGWRDPDSISKDELEAVKSRLKAAGAAGINIQKDPRLWSDFVQFLALMWLEVRKEREADLAALGDSGSDSKPS
jgi:hypothetical protein